MLSKDICLTFLLKAVDVAVPNFIDTDRLFFHRGILTEVTDDDITLKFSDGFKIIPIEKIIEIRLTKNEVR